MGMGARGRRDYAQNATGMRKMVQGSRRVSSSECGVAEEVGDFMCQ